MQHRELLRIDLEKLRLVFDIHKHVTLVVAGRKFGLAAHGNHARNFAIGGVDRNGVGAAAIEGENAFRCRVVVDGIGIQAARLDRADRLQCFQIKDGDRVGFAVASKAAAEIGRQRDAMNA